MVRLIVLFVALTALTASCAHTTRAENDAEVRAVLDRYLSTATHPDRPPIDPEIFSEDIVATWSDGETHMGRDAMVEACEAANEELARDFESFGARAEDLVVEQMDDLAAVSCLLVLEGILTEGRGTFRKTVRSSFALERTGGRWLIVSEKSVEVSRTIRQ